MKMIIMYAVSEEKLEKLVNDFIANSDIKVIELKF